MDKNSLTNQKSKQRIKKLYYDFMYDVINMTLQKNY